MDGYYEWVRDEKGEHQQPYFIAPADGSSLYMATLMLLVEGSGWPRGSPRLVTTARSC